MAATTSLVDAVVTRHSSIKANRPRVVLLCPSEIVLFIAQHGIAIPVRVRLVAKAYWSELELVLVFHK